MSDPAELPAVASIAKFTGVDDCTAVVNGIRWRYLHAGSGPALVLWSERDRAIYPRSAYELQGRWKNSAVIMMKDIGHMPYEEVSEEFNRTVLDFLLRDAPTTPLQDQVTTVASQLMTEPSQA
jgi:pimeloyl-ACP methyl ester carboxylesterase